MEEQTLDLLNIDQEDDNLLEISSANAEVLLGVSPLLPSMTAKGLEQASMKALENSFESILYGIDETSPIQNSGAFKSQLTRSYLDIENEQAGFTPEKRGSELVVLRKSKSRRSTTLRKSLAWDQAFFTNEGVLNNDELFAVASDAPEALTMPELATIWDGPQTVMTPCGAKSTPTHTVFNSKLRVELRPGVRKMVRPEVTPAVNPKPQQDISHTSSLRPDNFHTCSLRPVRRIYTPGFHAFSNAYSRAAVISQYSTSIPLPNSLPREGKQLEPAVKTPSETSQGTGLDQMREPPNSSTGLHHQARLAALTKAHESSLQKGPRVRLLKSTSHPFTESNNHVKQSKNLESNHLEELRKLKVEAKHSEKMQQLNIIPMKQPEMARSMSTSALLESPSVLSLKVSYMSKKVETLGKVLTGREPRVPSKPSLSHSHPFEKPPMLSKSSGALPTVVEAKDPSYRTTFNASVVPVKHNKEFHTVKDRLQGKGTPSSREASKHGPTPLRSKSVCGVPRPFRATGAGLVRVTAITASPPPPQSSAGKQTGLRKPSPKLGFFDAGRATSAPLKAFTSFHPLQRMQTVPPGGKASTPIKLLGRRSHGKISSVIPSALLSRGVVSAPTAPRGIHVLHPTSFVCESSTTTRPSSSSIAGADFPSSFSGIEHSKQLAESQQLLAMEIQLADITGTVPDTSALNAFELPETLSTYAELIMDPVEELQGCLQRRFAQSSPSTPPAVKSRGPAYIGSRLESGGAQFLGDTTRCADLSRLQNSDRSYKFGDTRTEKYCLLEATYDYPGSDRESSIVFNKPMSSCQEHQYSLRSSTGISPNEGTKVTGSRCVSPRSLSLKENYFKAVNSREHNNIAPSHNDLSTSAYPSTPAWKDRSRTASAQLSEQFDSLRSMSFNGTSLRTITFTDIPVATNNGVLRSNSQPIPWQSQGFKVIRDLLPGVSPSTFDFSGKRHIAVSPSIARDATGKFEVFTPSRSKSTLGTGTSSSSEKNEVREIVDIESPSSQWSNWPVLGATNCSDEMSVSVKEEFSFALRRSSREQESTESRSNSSAGFPRSPSLKAKHAGIERASDDQGPSSLEQLTHSQLSFSTGFVSTLSDDMAAEMDSGSVDGNALLGLNGVEARLFTPASAKKEKGAPMFSFAQKAVTLLTSSSAPPDSVAQEKQGTPRSSRKPNHRFNGSGSSSNFSASEPNLLFPFSEARICELEAAGPQILEKKSGRVQNSPPGKVVRESNPWSPVRKNGQLPGPFDCTKLKYITPGLASS